MIAPWQTWRLEPRDPLVFGDGARVPALVPHHSWWLPPQPSLAGFVRSRFVAGQARVTPETAESLLDVAIRGPWLVSVDESGPRKDTLWLPAPADAVLAGRDESATWLRGTMLSLGPDEGVNWPVDPSVGLAPVLLPDRFKGEKTRRPEFPFWPFEDLLAWGLDQEQSQGGRKSNGKPQPAAEYRVHVQIGDDSGTAAPEALFSSAGVRYPERFHLAVEVRDGRRKPASEAGQSPGQPPLLAVLGGESRAVRLEVTDGSCLPDFKTVRDRFQACVEGWIREGRKIALRLQLLTPGCFGGWKPAWPPEIDGLLLSVVLPRYTAVSGWNLQRRGPRKVRRLVPPGSVYTFGPVTSADGLLAMCERLWGQSLCAGQPGDGADHLAPPDRDGYGIVLPTPTVLHWETP